MTTTTDTTDTLSRIGIPTGTWKVDKAHTRVGFAVRQLGVVTTRGEFREFDGALEIGEELRDSRAYGWVDASSVDTNQARRDRHLRSSDFLSAERHPELIFRSLAIEPVDEDTFRAIGNLSINGVTNEVELTAELGGIETGPEGEERLSLELTGQVSRKAFAMKYAPAVVADKVKIVVDVEAVKEAMSEENADIVSTSVRAKCADRPGFVRGVARSRDGRRPALPRPRDRMEGPDRSPGCQALQGTRRDPGAHVPLR
jgi:polyisoprenoid-binding protein YceI